MTKIYVLLMKSFFLFSMIGIFTWMSIHNIHFTKAQGLGIYLIMFLFLISSWSIKIESDKSNRSAFHYYLNIPEFIIKTVLSIGILTLSVYGQYMISNMDIKGLSFGLWLLNFIFAVLVWWDKERFDKTDI